MRFGAFLPTYWDDYGAIPLPAAIAEAAKTAEALGYEGVWANDQVISAATADQVVEPLVTLASLVYLVPRVTLGTNVLVLPQRNPVLVAKQAAALHLLSGGRLVLGVGIGHRAEEFALLGADFAGRAAATDAAIEVLRTLWRPPDGRDQGVDHRFDGVGIAPHPPGGGPPIWIGGNTPAAVRRAARSGSGWLPFTVDLDAFRAGVALLRELTRERGCLTIGHTFYVRIRKPDEPEAVRSTTPWLPAPFAGSPDAVAEHLGAYWRAGLEYAICAFESEDLEDLLRQMHLFAEQVAPRFVEA